MPLLTKLLCTVSPPLLVQALKSPVSNPSLKIGVRGTAVAVGVAVGMLVDVAVGVAVGVFVNVAVGATVGVFVGVADGVGVGVFVGPLRGVLVGVAVRVGVLVGIAVVVGVAVIVGVGLDWLISPMGWVSKAASSNTTL